MRQEAPESNWRLDESRSRIDLGQTGSVPLHTEVEALLTFRNDGAVDDNQPDTQDGTRAVSDIVAGGLLTAQRMARLAVIAHVSSGGLTPGKVASS